MPKPRQRPSRIQIEDWEWELIEEVMGDATFDFFYLLWSRGPIGSKAMGAQYSHEYPHLGNVGNGYAFEGKLLKVYNALSYLSLGIYARRRQNHGVWLCRHQGYSLPRNVAASIILNHDDEGFTW